MHRRAFLKTVAASGVLAGAGSPALAYARRKPTMTILTDVDPATPIPILRAILGGMLDKGLPVTCIVHTRAPDGTRLRPENAVAGLLREYMTNSPGLIEIMANVPDLAGQLPHFQARLAYAAKTELIEALLPPGDMRDTGAIMLSIACKHEAKPLSPESVRSAGIRNVLVLPNGSAPVTTETWHNGVLRVFGGVRGDLFAAVESLGLPGDEQYQNVILLSVRQGAFHSEHMVAAAARVFANVALQHEADQWISNVRLGDLQLRDGYFDFQRSVGLHLFEPGPEAPELRNGFEKFQRELKAQRIPFSTGPAPRGGATRLGVQGYWVATESAADPTGQAAAAPATLVRLGCGLSPSPVHGKGFLDAGIGVVLDPRSGGHQGVDRCGALHVPHFPVTPADASRPRLLSGAGGNKDLVITIAPELLATRAIRSALQAELTDLTRDWVTRLVPVDQFVRPIAPGGHLTSLYRQTEAYKPRIAPTRREISDSERQTLLENALMAWSYFYRFTDKRTGLCPATVLFSLGENVEHQAATMWDVGSHINALMAAVDLEIISDNAFRRSIDKILTSIAGRLSNGRNLPSEWIRTDRIRYGNRNFDASDAGRLLAALWNLSRHRLGNDRPADLVNSWDLEKIIVEGHIHSVKEGRLQSAYESHSAHYAARAFRAWGFDVASPYEVFGSDSDCDDRMKLLHAAAEIGPLGAEPLLLEAMDLGFSPESAYLADVLFGAQLREYDTTGELVCVSEGPIDRTPWFTYQGLQFDAPDRTWAIDTVRNEPGEVLDDSLDHLRVVSSKAAFLWSAQVPHTFSDQLLEHVRKHGKTTIGFASSIYSRTHKATRNYSDINTNGIILQAVSRILRGPNSS